MIMHKILDHNDKKVINNVESDASIRNLKCRRGAGWFGSFWIKLFASDDKVANKIVELLTKKGGSAIDAETLRWFSPKQLGLVKEKLSAKQMTQNESLQKIFKKTLHFAVIRSHSDQKKHTLVQVLQALAPANQSKQAESPVTRLKESEQPKIQKLEKQQDQTEKQVTPSPNLEKVIPSDPVYAQAEKKFLEKVIVDVKEELRKHDEQINAGEKGEKAGVLFATLRALKQQYPNAKTLFDLRELTKDLQLYELSKLNFFGKVYYWARMDSQNPVESKAWKDKLEQLHLDDEIIEQFIYEKIFTDENIQKLLGGSQTTSSVVTPPKSNTQEQEALFVEQLLDPIRNIVKDRNKRIDESKLEGDKFNILMTKLKKLRQQFPNLSMEDLHKQTNYNETLGALLYIKQNLLNVVTSQAYKLPKDSANQEWNEQLVRLSTDLNVVSEFLDEKIFFNDQVTDRLES